MDRTPTNKRAKSRNATFLCEQIRRAAINDKDLQTVKTLAKECDGTSRKFLFELCKRVLSHPDLETQILCYLLEKFRSGISRDLALKLLCGALRSGDESKTNLFEEILFSEAVFMSQEERDAIVGQACVGGNARLITRTMEKFGGKVSEDAVVDAIRGGAFSAVRDYVSEFSEEHAFAALNHQKDLETIVLQLPRDVITRRKCDVLGHVPDLLKELDEKHSLSSSNLRKPFAWYCSLGHLEAVSYVLKNKNLSERWRRHGLLRARVNKQAKVVSLLETDLKK